MLAGYESPTDAQVLIMMAHNNSRQRLDVLESTCEQLVDHVVHVKAYKAVIKKIKSAQAAPNKYVHSEMSIDDKGEVHATLWSARGTFKAEVERVRVSEMREVTARIHEAVCALQSLIGGGEIKPMWER